MMIVLVGESASGKSSIERMLVKKYGYSKIVSYTTRKPRKNEIDGVDYHFIDEKKFKILSNSGFFIETATYNGWSYGTSKEDFENNNDKKIAVLTPHGLRQAKKYCDNIKSFYIKISRRDRLIKILKRGDDIEEAYRRNLSDVGMFDGIEDEVDFVIHNHNYIRTIDRMAEIVNDLASL